MDVYVNNFLKYLLCVMTLVNGCLSEFKYNIYSNYGLVPYQNSKKAILDTLDTDTDIIV